MALLAVLLWIAALLATAAAVAFYRWAHVSRGWRIFHTVVAAPVVAIGALFALVSWPLGPPIILLLLAAGLFGLAYQWKIDLLVARWLDKRLSGGKEIFTLFFDAPPRERREPRRPDETHNG